jgi:archaellum component FlaC
MSLDLGDVYRRLNEVEKQIYNVSKQVENLLRDVKETRQEVVETRREVLNAVEKLRDAILASLAALTSAVAELRRYVEDKFNELKAMAEEYRKEFLAEHEKRHREAVALSAYQQDFLKNLDIAMLGIKARIEEISQILKELEDKARKIDTRLFEYSLRLVAERVEIK